MVNRLGPKLLYGEQPYGLSQVRCATDSVTGLTRDDVTSFYAKPRWFGGLRTGAGGRRDASWMRRSWLSSTSAAGRARLRRRLAAIRSCTPGATHVVIVDKPGAPQTALEVFGIGVPAGSPDLQTLQVMNYVMGGSFASRINMNLREVHGYTYGANSDYQNYRAGGLFVAGGLVRTDVTGPAAKELMGEIRKFPSQPAGTEAELNEAKVARIQSLPGQFETSFAIARSMTSIFLYNRPLDYYSTLPAKYEAVTAADVERVAKEDVYPDQLIIVAAGDRAKIEPQLKDAGLGPVEVRDINGKLVTNPQ